MTDEFPAELEKVGCPVCDSAPCTVWMRDKPGTQYVRCLGCSTVYASPRTSRANRYSSLAETFSASPETFVYAEGRRKSLQAEAAIIQRIKPHGKLLDIGCCTGAIFEFFGEEHWQRHGVELSPSAAAHAQKTYGAQVHNGTLHTAHFPAHSFDVITLIDMFYYIDDPRAELLEILRLIRPDGVLAIELTGQSYMLTRSRGIPCFILNGTWKRLSSESSYLYWYTPKSLGRLLKKYGFRPIGWEPIPNAARGSVGKLLSCYDRLCRIAAKRLSFFLNWTPKYLCLAIPDGMGHSSVS